MRLMFRNALKITAVAVFCLTLAVLATRFLILTRPGSPDAQLEQADKAAWLNAWIPAEPLYKKAEASFLKTHELSKALYAHVSQIPAHMETGNLQEQIWTLTQDLALPVPVIDLTLIAKIVQEATLLRGILDNSIKIYNNAKSQLSAFQYNATPLKNKNWLSFFRGLHNDSILNRFGETATVSGAMNSSIGIPTAWQIATLASPNLSNLSGETVGSSANLAHLATMEMQDSAAMNAMSTLGDYRVTESQNQADYDQLDKMVASTDPDLNTQAAQQNIANGVALQQLKAARTQTQINAALLEQQLAANKYSRDSMASHLNLFAKINQLQGSTTNWMIDPDPSGRNYLVP